MGHDQEEVRKGGSWKQKKKRAGRRPDGGEFKRGQRKKNTETLLNVPLEDGERNKEKWAGSGKQGMVRSRKRDRRASHNKFPKTKTTQKGKGAKKRQTWGGGGDQIETIGEK